MERFVVNQVDGKTYIVVDQQEQREICVCENYEGWEDAKERAAEIALLLNKNQEKILQLGK
jgi:hypothetical protein